MRGLDIEQAVPLLAILFLLAGARGYQTSIEHWRAAREAKLRAEDGWLSLAGLFWLQPGPNTVGSGASAQVRLPIGFPDRIGTLTRAGDRVHLKVRSGAGVTLNGRSIDDAELRSDKSGSPDVIRTGRLTLLIIQRGSKLGVRVKDPQSPARVHFSGLRWFPADPRWAVRAKFVPNRRVVFYDAQAGDKQEYVSPGYVEWTQDGQTFRLTPVLEDDQLFFVFRDATAGKSTYAAARFLYADLPKKGQVLVDFNKAYNPPCVFTPFATCPLPPAENRLKIPVSAGEMMYTGHDGRGRELQ